MWITACSSAKSLLPKVQQRNSARRALGAQRMDISLRGSARFMSIPAARLRHAEATLRRLRAALDSEATIGSFDVRYDDRPQGHQGAPLRHSDCAAQGLLARGVGGTV